MKSILTIAAAALLGTAGFANAETVLNSNQMDQVTAGIVGVAYSVGASATLGDLLSETFTKAETLVNLPRLGTGFPLATSSNYSTGIAASALQGGVAASASGSASGAALGN